jgi:hypothetical protein
MIQDVNSAAGIPECTRPQGKSVYLFIMQGNKWLFCVLKLKNFKIRCTGKKQKILPEMFFLW